MRMRLLVRHAGGRWCGEWEAAGHQRESVNIRLTEQNKFLIWNVEGRHCSQFRGRVARNGTLSGEVCQAGVDGGSFRLWPVMHGASCGQHGHQRLQRWYVALRCGPCQDVPICDSLQDLPSECAICLDGFDPGDMISRTPCSAAKHVYHRRCIQQWLESHRTCPLCRSVVRTDMTTAFRGTDRIVMEAVVMSRI